MSLEACPLLSIPITQFSTMYLKHLLQILELVSELWKYQPISVIQGTKYWTGPNRGLQFGTVLKYVPLPKLNLGNSNISV